MPAPIVVVVLALTATAAAQITRVTYPESRLDPRSRNVLDDPGKPFRTGSLGTRVGGPCGVAETWWYWNREAWLPQPVARTSPPPAAAAGKVATRAISADRAWLVAAARCADPTARALAIYTIGCAGPAFGGLDLITGALDDAHDQVRDSALLALGEHGGATARFRLIRAMNAAGATPRRRAVAVLAYGIAAAIDGDVGGVELRRFAAAIADDDGQVALCAADRLHGRAQVAAVATDWIAAGSALPAAALPCAASTWPRAGVFDRLRARLDAPNFAVRLAAREATVAFGEVPSAKVRKWLHGSSPDQNAHSIFAVVDHPDFPAFAKAGFADTALRGVYALALAVHARHAGYVEAVRDLTAASIKQRTFAERPLWLLAGGIVLDRAAAPRARGILLDSRSPERMRLAAADVLAIVGGEELTALRAAVATDPSLSIRLRAADGIARHAGSDDVRTLIGAIETATDPAERAALLVSLGRCRSVVGERTLRRYCGAGDAPLVVRNGAWLGLALSMRWSGPVQLARLPRGVAFGYLPGWLLDLVDARR